MNWELAGNCSNPDTLEGKLFQSLNRLEQIRKKEKVFAADADAWTIETQDQSVLRLGRRLEGETVVGLFNFSEFDKTARLQGLDGLYTDLISGRETELSEITVPAHDFFYFKRRQA